ncbi:hypothetical protein P0M11_11055 [Kaistella sp. PBT33-4]|uniref:hypothetical protein n=1 Tax=Kaistella sp. PBT33-4 TaxID=3032000 RepID=UPI0023D8AA26|nr:hypothetical protein [Kaistella sp. PBT33-4]MDF0720536.1 hypothetical protein [Kaistella sp. PBT33-4]
MEHWEVYQDELDRYREELDNDNYEVQEDVLGLEMKLIEKIQLYHESEDAAPYEKVLRELKALKQEFDFYDEEGELDMMFPNRHDDGFDEDSMSASSFFGDD